MTVSNSKVCTHCNEQKEITEYYRKKSSVDGYDYICKDCYRLWNSKWYSSNYEYALQKRREYKMNNHFKCNKLVRDWRKNNPEKVREFRMITKAKRKGMKSIKLFENPFPEEVEVDMHHINNMLVVPMPKRLHNINSHNDQIQHRNNCNVWLYKIYGMDIAKLMCDK